MWANFLSLLKTIFTSLGNLQWTKKQKTQQQQEEQQQLQQQLAPSSSGKTVRFSLASPQVLHFYPGQTPSLEYWARGRHRYCKDWRHAAAKAAAKLRLERCLRPMLHFGRRHRSPPPPPNNYWLIGDFQSSWTGWPNFLSFRSAFRRLVDRWLLWKRSDTDATEL